MGYVRLICCLAAVFLMSSVSHANNFHCALNIQKRDWNNSPGGSASAYIEAIDNWCETGDHIYARRLYTDELGYLAVAVCNAKFDITTISLDDTYSSLICIKSSLKEDRLE